MKLVALAAVGPGPAPLTAAPTVKAGGSKPAAAATAPGLPKNGSETE